MNIRIFFRSFIAFLVISLYFTFLSLTPKVLTTNAPLARHSMSLDNRYSNKYVNNVFKDNILLTMAYMSGTVHKGSDINWTKIKKPFRINYELRPGDVFAFHDDISELYKDNPVLTTNAHFDASEGFLSDGYLYGDGVCHLASLINWVALDAGLYVYAPTKHNFAVIPEIPEEFGVSIYTSPGKNGVNQKQNLYIENTLDKPVIFAFDYKNGVLDLTITENKF